MDWQKAWRMAYLWHSHLFYSASIHASVFRMRKALARSWLASANNLARKSS